MGKDGEVGENMSGECEECCEHTLECVCDLERCIEHGWKNCQPDSRPDESFRAILIVMKRWKQYLDSLKMYSDNRQELNAMLKAQGTHPMQNLSSLILDRMQDIGIAKEKLVTLLDDEIFDDLSKHNPWWESEHEAESDKLHDLRMKLGFMSEKLWEIWHVLDAKLDD